MDAALKPPFNGHYLPGRGELLPQLESHLAHVHSTNSRIAVGDPRQVQPTGPSDRLDGQATERGRDEGRAMENDLQLTAA